MMKKFLYQHRILFKDFNFFTYVDLSKYVANSD